MNSRLSIMIATRDREEDLRRTLQELTCLESIVAETLVVDDGSKANLREVLGPEFSSVQFLRFEECAGQSKRRSQAFERLGTEFILQLDDDSAPVDRDSVVSALEFLESHRSIGALAFYIYNGQELPKDLGVPSPRFHHSFVGCGVLFRSAALREVGGYQSFFQSEWEEEELALRLIKGGWAIYFFPSVLIHHRVSPANRNSARTWMRGFRNKLWAMVMHYPLSRVALEGTWVLVIAALDAVRLVRFRYLIQGVWQCMLGLPRVWRLRKPMSHLAMARWDALRFRGVYSANEYECPPSLQLADFIRWVRNWWNRPRERSFWDSRKGDIGTCETVQFAHQKASDSLHGK
jgi:GT2 family glycosyltransferase